MSGRALGAFKVFLVIAPFVALALFAYRPTPIVGVDASSLVHSIGGGLAGNGQRCKPAAGDWMCVISDGSGATTYRVEVDSIGCWEATRSGGRRSENTRDGCVSLLDHFRLL